MTYGRHAQFAVKTINAYLQTNLPTVLGLVGTALSLTLPVPTSYLVTRDFGEPDGPYDIPILFTTYEGGVDHEGWLTPQTDLGIPLFVFLVCHPDDDPETAEDIAEGYAESIVRTLTDALDEVTTDIWELDIVDSQVEQYGSDRNRRSVTVRANVEFRTTRTT
jgi:hypothetical protein